LTTDVEDPPSCERPGARVRCPTCLAVFRTGFLCCPADGSSLDPWNAEADPLIGCEIAGRYVIESRVGEGSMGLIYRARHIHLPRPIALKILFGDLVSDPRMRLRFAQEAELASRLSHPNVVPVVDFGLGDGGLLYLAMDFVDGEMLSELIAREAPLDPLQAVRLARQLAQGLGHAHKHGLVHRDLKPGNVILERRGEGPPVPRILDFGLAISIPGGDGLPGRLTESGYIVGTPIYIAPEQVLDRELDGRADLFALGVVLYEMLAGKPPFDGRPAEIAHKNMAVPVPRIEERSPGVAVAPALEGVIRRLLEKAPESRFSSADELIAVLDEVERAAAGSATYGMGMTVAGGLERDRVDRASRPGSLTDYLPRDSIDVEPRRWMRPRHRRIGAAGAVMVAAGALAHAMVDRPGPLGAVRFEPPVLAAAMPPSQPEPRPDPEPRLQAGAGSSSMTERPAAPDRRKALARLQYRVREARPVTPVAPRTSDAAMQNQVTAPGGRRKAAGSSFLHEAPAERLTRAGPANQDPSASRLIRDYREVGEAIGTLQDRYGERSARAFRERYFRVPYGDALRIVVVRRDALIALADLRQEVASAMARAASLRPPEDAFAFRPQQLGP
jgi:hypothetical protein